MHRRNMLQAAISTIGAFFTASGADAAAPATTGKLRVVYHLSDFDRANFVLVNIGNHVDGVGGPENVTIALVVHGPALRAFQTSAAHPGITGPVVQLARAGYELAACGNSMRAQNLTLKDLLPGFVAAEKGGVVRIAELQAQGYLYIRP
ncbi:MAG: DsrE family protein [Bradyrhizobium sp.]|uniref:DsrE family protein n=1 Tax=Bradyrhizobium sp. TaxID=376 RepID=UPI001D351517|nr:DsrE family protein [Bradyrhizobium sp.]MBV9563016.1 DsrE family protein [Bradyrhizobium sp.]